MAKPFTISNPKPMPAGPQQTELIPNPPRGNDHQVNEERCDIVPMQSPAIPWPAPDNGKKPMRFG